MIILLFGQPASGKTTLADKLSKYLENVVKVDGDRWRDVTKNKDYSKEGRLRNLKGAFDMAIYLENEGFKPILSFVTPYQELRDYLKENAKDLLQVYLTYQEDRGRFNRFAEDFEHPIYECLDLHLDTSSMSAEECTSKILSKIVDRYVE